MRKARKKVDRMLTIRKRQAGDESNDETSSDQSEDERDEDDKPIKPQLPQTDVGTTLFIRNIPYDAIEDELRTL